MKLILRMAICAVLGLVGVLGMKALAAAKTPPEATERKAESILAKSLTVHPVSVQTVLRGFGEVRAVTRTDIGAEVAGRVTKVHPDLREGGIIPAGEILFELDATEYALRVHEFEAALATASNAVTRLELDHASNVDRLHLLRRTLELAEAHHERVRALFEQSQVGSRVGVEEVERERNAAAEQIRALQAEVDAYPIHVDDNARHIQSVSAQLERARLDQARCTVKAPYPARVVRCDVEQNQWVAPGASLLTLADDSVLELHVALDSAEAGRNLLFLDNATPSGWFGQPAPVACRLYASDNGGAMVATGRVHRVVNYDRASRMVTVAVRVEAKADDSPWPVADGMFCRVELPGRTIEGVFALPRHAVTPRGEVYCAVDGLLKTRPVKAVYADHAHTYIGEGLAEGDIVLTSRLSHPLENTPVTLEDSTL